MQPMQATEKVPLPYPQHTPQAPGARWSERLRQAVPSREALAAHPWLRPVAGRLLQAQLWRFQQEAVARGVAVGTFWAFAIPFGQIVVAVFHCTWWRANIPAAAAMTLLTNPLTVGFWLWLAYQVGEGFIGAPGSYSAPADMDLAQWFATYGWPTVLGMGLFAVGGAAMGYLLVKLLWRLKRLRRRRQRG